MYADNFSNLLGGICDRPKLQKSLLDLKLVSLFSGSLRMRIHLFEDLGCLLSLVQKGQPSLHYSLDLHNPEPLSMGLAIHVCFPHVSVWKKGSNSVGFWIHDSVQFSDGVSVLLLKRYRPCYRNYFVSSVFHHYDWPCFLRLLHRSQYRHQSWRRDGTANQQYWTILHSYEAYDRRSPE